MKALKYRVLPAWHAVDGLVDVMLAAACKLFQVVSGVNGWQM